MLLEQRIMSRIVKDDVAGCWVWVGGRNSHGYGYIAIDGRMRGVHRVMWELHCGAVPAGLQLDHLCRNRVCCNPGHLEPVTMVENIRRGNRGTNGNERKTHCPQGHEYSQENTHHAIGSRMCRECMRVRSRRAYHANKEKACVV